MRALIGVVTPPTNTTPADLVEGLVARLPQGSRVYDASQLWGRLEETTNELAKACARIAALEEQLAQSSHHG